MSFQELHPYAKSAQGRINQFCDYIGVTDRFTGYRHNLTRGSRDPTKLGMAWLNPAETKSYDRSVQYAEKPATGMRITYGYFSEMCADVGHQVV